MNRRMKLFLILAIFAGLFLQACSSEDLARALRDRFHSYETTFDKPLKKGR